MLSAADFSFFCLTDAPGSGMDLRLFRSLVLLGVQKSAKSIQNNAELAALKQLHFSE